MECRTHQKRIEIIKNYYVKPIEHNIIIKGGYIKGDAGKSLKNEYYKFIIKNKSNINEIDTIICGNTVAYDFAKILNIKLPPIFNIFIDDDYEMEDSKTNNNNKTIWNSTNKQLYNAIRIIMLKYDIKPFSPLYSIYNDVIKNKNYINYINIKGCNTILLKLNKNNPKTLTDILNEFIIKNSNKQIKNFKFNELTNYLIKYTNYDKIYLK